MENRTLLIDTNNQDRTSILKEYYAKYLSDVRGLKPTSINHYYDALNNISRRLVEKGLLQTNIYEIEDLDELSRVREILLSDPDFIEFNKRGNHMYSAGLNNYFKFATGDGFVKAKEKIILLDTPMLPRQISIQERENWKRSGIMRTQALWFADYACEINQQHKSFIAEKNHKPYMEGHHAIPLGKQSMFQYSLDVYANIVCLCPICHRQIHYGLKANRIQMMNQLYENRADRLYQCGIRLSKDEFSRIAL